MTNNGPALDLIALLFASFLLMTLMADFARADDTENSCYTIAEECFLNGDKPKTEVEKLREENQLLLQKLAHTEGQLLVLEQKNRLEQQVRRLRRETRRVYKKNRNAVNTLVGRTDEGFDYGLQFQRDFGRYNRWRGSIGATINGAAHLGLGLNF